MRQNKSAIDLLERVTEGGVHVSVEAPYVPEEEAPHESILGAETEGRAHPLDERRERRHG